MWSWMTGRDRRAWIIERRALVIGRYLVGNERVDGPLGRVGLLRAARLPGGGCEVSIALLEAARGRGLGTVTLSAMTSVIHSVLGGPVYARIRLDNVFSLSAFLKAGFVMARGPQWERVSEGQHGVYVLRWPSEEVH